MLTSRVDHEVHAFLPVCSNDMGTLSCSIDTHRVAFLSDAANAQYAYPYYYPPTYPTGGIYYPPTPQLDEAALKEKLKGQMYVLW